VSDPAEDLRRSVDAIADLLDLPLEGDEPVAELAERCRMALRSTVGRDHEHLLPRTTRRARRDQEAQEQREAAKAALAGWQLGRVVEDRWGLRWRGDIRVNSGGKGWSCQSAGIRAWRTSEQMLDERAPLTFVRMDAGAGTDLASRKAGAAEDAAVTVNADAAEVLA
jgi:hypothetical protein